MGQQRTILIDDMHRRVPRDAVAASPSPARWLIEPMDGGPALVAPPGCRAPDLVLSQGAEGSHEVYIGLCSLDGQSSEVEVRMGPDGPFRRLRWEGGEIGYREVSLGIVEMRGKEIVLRHPAGGRSCVSHVRLVPR